MGKYHLQINLFDEGLETTCVFEVGANSSGFAIVFRRSFSPLFFFFLNNLNIFYFVVGTIRAERKKK